MSKLEQFYCLTKKKNISAASFQIIRPRI